MHYTLGSAAKATGKSKPTIQRAIKSGKMSAIKNEDGSYIIDPAELHRVFQTVTHDSNDTGDMKQNDTPIFNSALQHGFDALHELVDNLKNERDDLRRRLDNSEIARMKNEEELRRLTMMLTHQPESGQAKPEPEQPKSLLWQKLFGRGSH
jgi:hypothetical protein